MLVEKNSILIAVDIVIRRTLVAAEILMDEQSILSGRRTTGRGLLQLLLFTGLRRILNPFVLGVRSFA